MRKRSYFRKQVNGDGLVTWYTPQKTVVLQQYLGEVTKDDLYNMARESADLLKSVPHTVHLIIDERGVENMLTTTDMQFLEKMVPPNQGAVIVIVPEHKLQYKKIVQGMGSKIAPHAFAEETIFVSSLEEAHAYLQAHCALTFTDLVVK